MVFAININAPSVSPMLSSLQVRLPPTISPNSAMTISDERPFHSSSGTILTNDNRPFRCPEPGCYQRFKRKFTLAEHMKTHTGERPFICPVYTCGKSFATSGNLSRHKRLHPWLKPQVCLVDGCGRAFSNEAKLERHLKTHFKDPRVGLSCEVEGCAKTFSTIGNLTRHLKQQHQNHIHQEDSHGDCHECHVPPNAGFNLDVEIAKMFPTQKDPASKAFSPLQDGVASPVSDEELLEFLEELF